MAARDVDDIGAVSTTVLGYPRIGRAGELKAATEAYCAGRIDATELELRAAQLRAGVWAELAGAGLDEVPSNTFSFYDQVLDTAVLFDAVPDRYRQAALAGGVNSRSSADLDIYFTMARGGGGLPALGTANWFTTSYRHVVPELDQGTRFRLAGRKPLREFTEARRDLGLITRPVLLGPLTFLLVARASTVALAGFTPLDLLDDLVAAYVELLGRLAEAGAVWVQLDEPALARDLSEAELAGLRRAYRSLAAMPSRPKLFVSTCFGEIGAALPVLASVGVDAIGLDFVAGPGNLVALAGIGGIGATTIVAGLVDGRNVWRTDLRAALATCVPLLGLAGDLVVSSSCSLRHVPLDLTLERGLDARLIDRMAFARQKVDEIVLLGRALREDLPAVAEQLADADARRAAVPEGLVDEAVRARVLSIHSGELTVARAEPEVRAAAQAGKLGLPVLPTTAGSFRPDGAIGAPRSSWCGGTAGESIHVQAMAAEIDRLIALQEDIGLDVLVHGELEPDDLVRVLAERLTGYATTDHGWVQSDGMRYVRPPILFGDVARPGPMTVRWASYAQARTSRPVKAILPGPVTMLASSFVREDQAIADTARQLALVLRDEIDDLQVADIRIIQIDEPGVPVLTPLRRGSWKEYLRWTTETFRLATSAADAGTQIHTRLCCSEPGDVVSLIEELDADVACVEAAGAGAWTDLVADLRRSGYRRALDAGVGDRRVPRAPTVQEIEEALRLRLAAIEPALLWVSPGWGTTTRDEGEIEIALRNMVAATRRIRGTLPRTSGQG
ncbi:5-methyltetrahydropteroyltriglutamate--homocysteine methyltransferase [Frankia sp. R43]|uniref:5-methyltetrahydropteroyltriglutamate-- homocysteine S-methyltransferase n=1 Tax=Frankia sp. R43 TaxID=269536 RepID=UPI0006C9FFE1|nr:5-methyltetrahydropteroyltriglutamate--homocysteine S-methyltransferase [Frankia sp. R43]KPM55424.1 5-methyltetrahydropteroyltriglutamate--homocysteine methyltransferase [Frankia sp. R43]